MTYMRDEKKFLEEAERKCTASDPHLAHQIKVYREERGRFNNGHVKRLAKLLIQPGFTGSLSPGAALGSSVPGISSTPQTEAYNVENGDDDVDSEPEDDEDILAASIGVLTITSDN